MNNILFNTLMTISIQNGIKTQTRREFRFKKGIRNYVKNSGVLCLQHRETGDTWYGDYVWSIRENNACWADYKHEDFLKEYSPYQIGEILWIREPVKVISFENGSLYFDYIYLSDNEERCCRIPDRFLDLYKKNNESIKTWQPTKKWIINCQGVPNGCITEMARTYIKITNIRIEKLNEITEEDSIKEGTTSKLSFQILWEKINGKNSFDDKWVWVFDFEIIDFKK